MGRYIGQWSVRVTTKRDRGLKAAALLGAMIGGILGLTPEVQLRVTQLLQTLFQ